MKVRLRNPDREVDVAGPKRVKELLAELGVNPDTVLVIRDRALITREERVFDTDEIEIRPVISGGSRGGSSPAEAQPERIGLRTPLVRGGPPQAGLRGSQAGGSR